MSKPEHWGLGQVLWVCQGDATELCVGESQQARLREALKITLDGTQGEAIEQTVKNRYRTIFTNPGQYRSGERNKAEALRLHEAMEQARQRVEQLQRQRGEVEQQAHDLDAAEDEHEQTRQQLEQIQRDIAGRREALKELDQQRRAYEQRAAEAKEAERAWQTINGRVRAIQEADEAADEAAAQVEAAGRVNQQQRGRWHEIGASLREAKEAQRAAADHHRQCEKASAEANRLSRWLTCQRELTELREKRDHAQALQKQAAELQQELTGLAAPTGEQLNELRQLQQQIAQKQAELDAASLSVRIEPERDLSMRVGADGEPAQPRHTAEPVDLRALSVLTLDIEGVGGILIRGGESDAAELNEGLEHLRQRWRQTIAGLASEDLAELQELQTRQKLIRQKFKDLREQVEGNEPAVLEIRISELQRDMQALLAEAPGLAEADQTAAEADRACGEAEKRLTKARQAADEAEAELEQTQEQWDAARDEAAERDRQFSAARATLKVREEDADRRRREDQFSDQQRQQALLETREKADASRQRLAAMEEPPTEDLAQDIEQLETQYQQHDLDLKNQISRISRLQNEVRRAGGLGLYSELAEAFEELDELTRQHERAQLDAEAVRLLWETIHRNKQEVFEAILSPVRQTVTATMQRLVGPRYKGVAFNERLMPTAVQPRTAEDSQAAVDALSFGTREQLMLSVRLALARLLARDGDVSA